MKPTLVILISLIACAAHAQQGTRNGEWHFWGGDAGSTRYAPLDQINAANAKTLEVAWRWQAPPINLKGTEADTNWQGTPLMIDGVLYVTAGLHQSIAIDPATGKTLWIFTPEPRELTTGRPGNPAGRSLA